MKKKIIVAILIIILMLPIVGALAYTYQEPSEWVPMPKETYAVVIKSLFNGMQNGTHVWEYTGLNYGGTIPYLEYEYRSDTSQWMLTIPEIVDASTMTKDYNFCYFNGTYQGWGNWTVNSTGIQSSLKAANGSYFTVAPDLNTIIKYCSVNIVDKVTGNVIRAKDINTTTMADPYVEAPYNDGYKYCIVQDVNNSALAYVECQEGFAYHADGSGNVYLVSINGSATGYIMSYKQLTTYWKSPLEKGIVKLVNGCYPMHVMNPFETMEYYVPLEMSGWRIVKSNMTQINYDNTSGEESGNTGWIQPIAPIEEKDTYIIWTYPEPLQKIDMTEGQIQAEIEFMVPYDERFTYAEKCKVQFYWDGMLMCENYFHAGPDRENDTDPCYFLYNTMQDPYQGAIKGNVKVLMQPGQVDPAKWTTGQHDIAFRIQMYDNNLNMYKEYGNRMAIILVTPGGVTVPGGDGAISDPAALLESILSTLATSFAWIPKMTIIMIQVYEWMPLEAKAMFTLGITIGIFAFILRVLRGS